MPSCLKVSGPENTITVDLSAVDASQCAMVVYSGAEYLKVQEATQYYSTCKAGGQCGGEAVNNPFALTAEEGALISAMVVSCWASAWAIRAVINVVKGSTQNE